MDRRGFLNASLGFACSLAASPLVTPVALAAAPTDNRLVVIILRGAMDGLDAIQPVGDPDWAGLRPTLARPEGLVDLGFWGLHPALAPLVPLWQAGEVGAVQAVSTPYRDRRSHFDGQDILEAGTTGVGGRDGWLNRLAQVMPGMRQDTAYAIGRERLLILSGEAAVSRWSPDARLSLTPQAELLISLVSESDPLFHAASAEAIEIVGGLDRDPEALRGADHLRIARFAADRLNEETRIASFSIGGWDTHARQAAGLSRALGRLAETILTLKDRLGANWDRTAVLCVTEFGRTARENGTAGTDHGTGGTMIYAGGALRGGQVLGDWPGLGEQALYAGRDLMPTRDLRAHAAWVMRGLFGVEASVLAASVFPDLDLGDDPGLLR